MPVQMSVHSRYPHIAMFFDKVGRFYRSIANIAGISLMEQQPMVGQITVDGTFSATTYRFLNRLSVNGLPSKSATATVGS